MKPGTAVSGRKPLLGFNDKPANTKAALAAKTRPLKRTKSLKSAAQLHGSDLNFLFPSSLTIQKLSSKTRLYLRHSFLPRKQVNAMPLYQALQDSVQDNKDVGALVQSASNISVKIMRRNSLLVKSLDTGPLAQPLPMSRPKSTQQTEKEFEEIDTSQGLAGLLREFARRQATKTPLPDPGTVQCTPKVPAKSKTHIPKSPSNASSSIPLHSALQQSPETNPVLPCDTPYSLDPAQTPKPQYTFISQYVEKWAPRGAKVELKRKLRGRLVRLGST